MASRGRAFGIAAVAGLIVGSGRTVPFEDLTQLFLLCRGELQQLSQLFHWSATGLTLLSASRGASGRRPAARLRLGWETDKAEGEGEGSQLAFWAVGKISHSRATSPEQSAVRLG